jgi:hypothetical protein
VTQIKLSNDCIGARETDVAGDERAMSPLVWTIVVLNYQWEETSRKYVYLSSTKIHLNRRSPSLLVDRFLNNLNAKVLSPITPCNGWMKC